MVIKKFNELESAQKIMQVGIDVKCMYTNFGGCAFFGFGDSESEEGTPTKIGVHACYINTYLPDFFEHILLN